MKKFLVLVLVLCMTFALAACSAQSGEETSDCQSDSAAVKSQQGNETEDSKTEDETSKANTSASEGNDTSSEKTGSKVLVAYFSCTGNTKGIAEHIVNILGADVYEIVPEVPYTDADLDYNDSSSRTTIEMNDNTSRPAISSSVENMEDYDTIFIGYPIWWGQAPHIVYTFFESYDFSGKTIVPFCTSGSSGVGSSASNLQSCVSGSVNWLDGTRLNSGASKSDVEKWIDGLGLELSAN